MREILFRGKVKDTKRMVLGDFFMTKNKEKKDVPCIWLAHGQSVEVIPETVGQFTGLTDKNGKKIFEGDILKVVTPNDDTKNPYIEEMFEICFDEKERAYKMRGYIGEQIDEQPFDFLKGEVEKYQVEVIGNIHDNPELLDD